MDPIVRDETGVDTTVTRPVTERSRITGTQVQRPAVAAPMHAHAQRNVDWGAVLASVVTGLAITTVLVVLGISTGLIAGDENTNADGAKGILSSVGAWTVIAAILGAFIGSVLGGRLARWLDRGSLAYHAITAWAVSIIASVLLLTLVAIGFGTTATSAATSAVAAEAAGQSTAGTAGTTGGAAGTNEPDAAGGDSAAKDTNGSSGSKSGADNAADKAGDALGGAGVALTLATLLTLVATVAGWWVGSRKQLTDFEREDRPDVPVAA